MRRRYDVGTPDALLSAVVVAILISSVSSSSSSSSSSSPKPSNRSSWSLTPTTTRPSRSIDFRADRGYVVDCDDASESNTGWFGRGREVSLFDSRWNRDPRGGQLGSTGPSSSTWGRRDERDSTSDDDSDDDDTRDVYQDLGTQHSRSDVSPPPSLQGSGDTRFFQPAKEWWSTHVSPSIKNMPKIRCKLEPNTTLKIRKTFRPLKTIVRLGADFNARLGVWQFKSSWEDAIIGGKLTLAGRELQISKSWQLSVGPVEDLVTRLRFRAAVDLSTWKAYVRVGFRTERLSPINVMEGFTLVKRVPLDGSKGHIKVEVRANFALPEPEFEYSTETQRSLVGMGDVEVNLEELNLVLDY